MARKKPARKKKIAKAKQSSSKRKFAAKKRAAVKAKATARKLVAKKKSAVKKAARKKPARTRSRARRGEVTYPGPPASLRGLGPESAGQSGDTQGLSRRELDDSESVEELLEEGQYAEAEAVSGVENALDPDQGEVKTREFPGPG